MAQVLPPSLKQGALNALLGGIGQGVSRTADILAEKASKPDISKLLSKYHQMAQPQAEMSANDDDGLQSQELPLDLVETIGSQHPELGKFLLKSNEARRAEKKSSDEYVQGILDSYESAEVSEANLDKMEALEKTGKLVGPFKSLVSQKIGIPLSIMGNPESEEFEKLVAQRGLQVGKAYGFGRILQTEYENFLRTIPSLQNSTEGRRRIVATLRYFDNLAKDRYKNYRQIMKENGGRRPSNLNELVTARMAPEYKKAKDILVHGSELVDVISPSGEKGKVPKHQLAEAVEEGYTIPGME